MHFSAYVKYLAGFRGCGVNPYVYVLTKTAFAWDIFVWGTSP